MNSFIKVYFFFLGILFFSIFFVLRPPEGEQRKQRNQEEVATLEVNRFVFLSVKDNKPEAKVVGQKGMQYEDREEFWDFTLTNYDHQVGGLKSLKTQNNEETFYALHGTRRDNRYLFEGGVRYSNTDGMSFKAQKALFLLKQKTLTTEGEFFAKTREGEFVGNNLYYNGTTQELKADKIQGKIWLKQ